MSHRWAPPPEPLLPASAEDVGPGVPLMYTDHPWNVEPDEIGLLLAANSLMLRCAQSFLVRGAGDDPARAAG